MVSTTMDSTTTDLQRQRILLPRPTKPTGSEVPTRILLRPGREEMEGPTGHAAEWQDKEVNKKALDAATKEATKTAETFAIKNKHAPNKTQGRILAQLAAERLAYEASEIWMNENAPDADITAEEIRQQLFEMVVDALVN